MPKKRRKRKRNPVARDLRHYKPKVIPNKKKRRKVRGSVKLEEYEDGHDDG